MMHFCKFRWVPGVASIYTIYIYIYEPSVYIVCIYGPKILILQVQFPSRDDSWMTSDDKPQEMIFSVLTDAWVVYLEACTDWTT